MTKLGVRLLEIVGSRKIRILFLPVAALSVSPSAYYCYSAAINRQACLAFMVPGLELLSLNHLLSKRHRCHMLPLSLPPLLPTFSHHHSHRQHPVTANNNATNTTVYFNANSLPLFPGSSMHVSLVLSSNWTGFAFGRP